MKKQKVYNGFMVFVAIACVLTFTLNMINHRFFLGDFEVYYTAAMNLFSGKQVYMISFYGESGFYKYSPSTLLFFAPYLPFNFKTAAIIHFFILGAVYYYTFTVIRSILRDYFHFNNVKHEILLLSLSFGCILIHFAREMHLGNINIVLLLLCCLSLRNFLEGKEMPGGIILGIIILVKPYLIILFLPLVLRKRWKVIAWSGLTITCGLIIPFIHPGPLKGIELYGDWIKTMMTHGQSFPGMTSLDYILRLLVPSWPAWGMYVFFIAICALVAFFIAGNIRKEKQEGAVAGFADMNFAFEWFLLIALLPNLIRTDWVLLLFSAPLITFMIFDIASRKKYGWIPVLIILLFFYGANSDDLLGRELSHTIMQSGLMGLGNFLLIAASLYMFLSSRSSDRTSA